ncbi:MAG: glycoside hydrolase family 97 catalytic domain-containing protein [Phycisphaerae bacterium]|jgi:alpha-glucosidase
MKTPPRRAWVLVGLILAGFSSGGLAAAAETEVESPGGQVRLKVVAAGPKLLISATLGGRAVLEPSAVAFDLDGVRLTEGVEWGGVERYRIDESYPLHGGHARAFNRCNGVRIGLKRAAGGPSFALEARAYDDAVGFRLRVPAGDRRRVPDEATAFVIPAGSTVWYHGMRGHYEGIHASKRIDDLEAGEWAAPPVTFELPDGGGFGALTEAGLSGYSGMTLRADGRRGLEVVLAHAAPVSYPFTLRYGEEEARRLSKPAAVDGEIQTPWRVVMIGRDLNALVNCDAVTNLSAPPDPRLFPEGAGTGWIKPGRAVWKYLDGGSSTLEGMKEFSRLAGELGFEYHVIEGFWQRWPDADLRELVAYSRQRGVGLWLWKHTQELRDPAERRRFFERCRDAGAVGVKLDFLDHEAREVIDFYEVLLREAAEHKLMVNFHGSNKPTGQARTWPNELTREAVKGMEGRNMPRARHDATLPFTRMLAGAADYTPVHFGERRGDTTVAHQVATAVVFTSPLLTYGAHPRKLLESPCSDVIRSIPATWDETVVLPESRIGELAALARRSGTTWFVGVVNGPQARRLRLSAGFLGPGTYRARLVRDGRSDDDLRVEDATHARDEPLIVELRAGGGFVGRWSPNPQP